MEKRIYFFHVFACLGPSGTCILYKKLAQQGLLLKNCDFFFDQYQIEKSTNISFGVIPSLSFFPDTNKLNAHGWVLIGKNHNHYVYGSQKNTQFDIGNYAKKQGTNYYSPILLITLPLCLFFLGEKLNLNSTFLYHFSTFLVYIGFLWQYVVEQLELKNILHMKPKTFLFRASLAANILCNCSQILFVLLLINAL